MRVVIYAAKSTADVRGSIPDQIKACEDYASAQGWTIDGKESDASASASAYSGSASSMTLSPLS